MIFAFRLDRMTRRTSRRTKTYSARFPRPSPMLGPMRGLRMPATAFGLPDLGLRRPSGPELGPTRAAPPPSRSLKRRLRGQRLPFTLSRTLDRGLCKKGVHFLAPVLGRRKGIPLVGGRFGGHLADSLFLSRRFFFKLPRLSWCSSAV